MNNSKKNTSRISKKKTPYKKTKEVFTSFTDQIFATCFLESYHGHSFHVYPYLGVTMKS